MNIRKLLTGAMLVMAFAGLDLNTVSADVTITDVCWTSEADKHIKDEEGLRKLAHLVNDHSMDFDDEVIYLEADITLGDEPFVPIGTLEHRFKGTFEGGGHTIKGMKLRDLDGKDCYGLFGVAYEAAIYDVKLYDVDIDITKAAQEQQNTVCVGGLAGICANCDIMMCCTESGSISAVRGEDGWYQTDAGGLIGIDLGGELRFCRNNVPVFSNYDNVGGLAGALAVTDDKYYVQNIAYCCNNADITSNGSKTYMGGLTALNTGGGISSCYNSGKVTNADSTNTSGIVAFSNSTASQIDGCTDLCPDNIEKTMYSGRLNIMYTSETYNAVSPESNGEGNSVERIDLEKLSELVVLEKLNGYESCYVWAINYGHPVLWWQAINGNDAVIRGDVSGDGYLAPKDIKLILKHISGASLLTGDRLICADYNNDGNVDLKDVLLIMNTPSRYFSYITT